MRPHMRGLHSAFSCINTCLHGCSLFSILNIAIMVAEACRQWLHWHILKITMRHLLTNGPPLYPSEPVLSCYSICWSLSHTTICSYLRSHYVAQVQSDVYWPPLQWPIMNAIDVVVHCILQQPALLLKIVGTRWCTRAIVTIFAVKTERKLL